MSAPATALPRFQTIFEFLALLERVKSAGTDKWIASCPCAGHAHGDRKRGLSILKNGDKIILNCHADLGHTAEDVMLALGRTDAHLFLERNGTRPREIAAYSYQDAAGNEVYQVVRFEPKDFRYRRFVNGKWTWDAQGVRKIPYRLPPIVRAGTGALAIAEGEKDADTLTAAGFRATSSKAWCAEWTEDFITPEIDIALFEDRDEAGKKIADVAAGLLWGKCRSLRRVALPGTAHDVSDWFAAGGTASELRALIDASPPYVNAPSVTVDEIEVEENPTVEWIPYPVHVWDGTLYGDFAAANCKDNFIPPEFFIESIKTVTGAIIGDRVRTNRRGGVMRQYCLLIGIPGCGKGEASRAAAEIYMEREEGANPFLRNAQQFSALLQTGAVKCNAASEVAIYAAAKLCPRVLLTPTEFSELLAKTRIENSALLSTVLEYFDTDWCTPSTSGRRKAEDMPTRCMLSMLSTTQRATLENALAAYGGIGEGNISRITFILNEESRSVASLPEPGLFAWRAEMFSRLASLEKTFDLIPMSDEGGALLDDWWRALKAEQHQDDRDLIARINIIALRNALHLAWLRNEGEKQIMKTDIEKAIRLADHQLSVRRTVIVEAGDNPLACMQQKIIAFLRRNGPSTQREIYIGTHAARMGTEVFKRAIAGLIDDGTIAKKITDRVNQFRYYLRKR